MLNKFHGVIIRRLPFERDKDVNINQHFKLLKVVIFEAERNCHYFA